MSDQLVTKTCTWKHTTFTTNKHPCPRWDSNPQSQQARGRKLKPSTARPLGVAQKDFGLSVILQDMDVCQTLNSSVTFHLFQTTPTNYIPSGEDGALICRQQIPCFYWTAQFIAFITLLKTVSQRFCPEPGGLSSHPFTWFLKILIVLSCYPR